MDCKYKDMTLSIFLLCVSTVCVVGQQARLGLISDVLQVPPVPSASVANRDRVTQQGCGGGQRCCCVPRGTCGGSWESLIDIRIVNDRHSKCASHEEYCCPDTGEASLNGNDCGLSKSHPSKQFHGTYGQADFGEYNFLVVILNRGNGFVGAGALINPTTVVTADHKVHNYSIHDLKIRAREWDAGERTEPVPHLEVGVHKIISHPQSHVRRSSFTNLENDVAVLKLAQPLDFRNEYLGSICLPTPRKSFTGERCWVAGWGKDAFGQEGRYQRLLKEVDVPILHPQDCEKRLRATRLGYRYKFNKNSFICAGGENGKDSCEGDGGAPLMCKVNDRWFLAGLVAWGIGCARPDVPGVYVNVPTFSNWINEHSR